MSTRSFRGEDGTLSAVRQTLVGGKLVGRLAPELLYRVDAGTNVIITLICHADGKRPASVCGRPAIRTLLKHVK